MTYTYTFTTSLSSLMIALGRGVAEFHEGQYSTNNNQMAGALRAHRGYGTLFKETTAPQTKEPTKAADADNGKAQ